MHELKNMLQSYIVENYERDTTIVVSDPSFFQAKKRVEKKESVVKIALAPPKKIEKKEQAPLSPPILKKVEPETIVPSPKPALPKVDFSPIYAKIAPSLQLHKNPPTDTLAKAIKNAWKDQKEFPSVPIFVHHQLTLHSALLKALAHAIHTKLIPSRCYSIDEIEKENRWSELFKRVNPTLILIPRALLFSTKHLLTYYRELPGGENPRLEKFPLLFLEDLEQYNDPKQKKVLWQQIVQKLKEV